MQTAARYRNLRTTRWGCAVALALLLTLRSGPSFARTIVITAPADGTTDAAPAINAAIRAASPTTDDVLQLPAGRYAIGTTLRLRSRLTLEGAGIGRTTLVALGALAAVVSISNTDHATLRGLTIDAGGVHADDGVAGDAVTFGLIEAIEVVHFTRTGIFGPTGVHLSSAIADTVIRGSRFRDIGAGSEWGVAVRVIGGRRVVIEGNTSLHTGRGAYQIKQSTDSIIRGNVAHDFVPLDVALGIEAFEDCDRVVIEDNEIDSWLSLDTAPFAAVRRNHLRPMSTTRQGTIGLEIVNSPNVVMTDNETIGPLSGSVGISIDSTRYLLLERNHIEAARGTLVEAQYNPGSTRTPTLGVYSYRNEYVNGPGRAVHAHSVTAGTTAGLVFDGDVARDWGTTGFFIQVPRVLLDGVTLTDATPGNGFFTDAPQVYVRACIGANCPASPPRLPAATPLPSASFSAAVSGSMVSVDGSASRDPQNGALNYLWDFGDGPGVPGVRASHVFAAPGVKRIVLIVWDPDGWGARAQRDVTIAPAAIDAGADVRIDAGSDARPDVASDMVILEIADARADIATGLADSAADQSSPARDSGPDASGTDAGATSRMPGCGCRIVQARSYGMATTLAWLIVAGALRRRRSRQCRTARTLVQSAAARRRTGR